MKRESHFQPPRQSVIYGYTRLMLDRTGANANTFAMAVAEQYLDTTAPDVRTVPFRLGEGDALLVALKNNGQILRRYMDGTVKALPSDLEDAWVMALPEPYRSDCERDLARRRGRWSTCELPDNALGQAMGMGQLAAEFAQLVDAMAPALADGQINADDLPHARRILTKSDGLIGAVLNVRRQITALLPDGTAHG